MQNTPLLGLSKPTDADTFDQTPFNANADILEDELVKRGVFRAHLNALTQNSAVNTEAAGAWDTELYDKSNYFDILTGKYQPTVKGVYFFVVQGVWTAGLPATTEAEVQLWLNGVKWEAARQQSNTSSAQTYNRNSFLIQLNGGSDFVRAGAMQDASALNTTVSLDFWGYRLVRE